VNNLEDLINRLANESTMIVEESPLPLKDKIAQLFERRKKEAIEIINRLPLPPNYDFPEINSLYDEINECVLFGLNGATITLCGILVEYALKRAVYFKECGYKFIFKPELWDKFENLNLGQVIKRAEQKSVIDAPMKKKLNKFKDDIRNNYNHYNIKKIVTGIELKGVRILNTTTNTYETKDLLVQDHPQFYSVAKQFIDKKLVYGILKHTNEIVESLLATMIEKMD
jgi:hypothetical protein